VLLPHALQAGIRRPSSVTLEEQLLARLI